MTKAVNKVTVKTLLQMKKNREKIVFLTAYDFFTARCLDQAGIEGILVGDSLNMVFYGRENTLSATMEQMILHTKAVSAGVGRALVVGDMPFLSYQTSDSDAILNAGRFLKEGGAAAVKMEGGVEMATRLRKVTEVGIPVMGHIGLTPQSIHSYGGYKVQGKTDASRNYLLESAQAVEEAGCFAVVLEAVKNEIAGQITEKLTIPTIGIGAGPATDGQIMVINDIMGMNEDFYAKFIRKYFNLAEKLREVGKQFIQDVKTGNYPGESESYG